MIHENPKLEDYNTIEPKDSIIKQKAQMSMADSKPKVMEAEQTTTEPPKRNIAENIRQWNERMPQPTFDDKNPEYLKRTAKLNAMARGLSTLGDLHSLAIGGNVNTPTKDTKTGRYIDNYFKYLDDYRKRKDDYDLKGWMNKLRGLEREQDINYREGAVDRQKEITDYQQKQREDWFGKQTEANRETNKIKHGYQMDEIKERGKYYYSRGSSTDKNKDLLTVLTDSGGKYELDKPNASLTYDKALSMLPELPAVAPYLFEKVPKTTIIGGKEFTDPNGGYDMVLRKGVSPEQLIRAYLQYQESQKESGQKGNTQPGGDYIDWMNGKTQQPTGTNRKKEPVKKDSGIDWESEYEF